MLKRKNKEKEGPAEIPGWTEGPYKIIVQDLAGVGLAESRDSKLKGIDPLDVVKVLKRVPANAGDVIAMGRRSWILLTAYRKVHQKLQKVLKEFHELEQARIEQDGRLVMLQCGQKLLKDKLEHYETVAEKTAVKVAQNKYKNNGNSVSISGLGPR